MTDSPITITIQGLPDLERKLGKLQASAYKRGILAAAGSDIRDYLVKYPPTGPGNSPGGPGSRWYERGYGPRWQTKGGDIRGSHTSERLGSKWAVKVEASGDRAVIGNNASYAQLVQDEEEQPAFHKARGWRTVQGAVREKGLEIIDKVRRAIQELWDRG